MKDKIYERINNSGIEGITAKELAGEFGFTSRGIWTPIRELEFEGKVFLQTSEWII